MNAVGVFRSKFFRRCAAVLIFALTAVQPSAFAEVKKSVEAEYSINFNGIGIGTFKLWSKLNDTEYDMKARAEISILAGILFDWKGNTVSSGRVLASKPQPYSYSFGYRTSDRRETIDLEFSNNIVKQIAVNPPQRRSSARVPVTSGHLRNVVDPLSAVMLLTNLGSKKSGKEVCTRVLPIFDGKARYDLRLTHKKTKSVNTSHGYRGPAYICKVKFVPIAGHKRTDDENNFAAKNDGIEIWMIPLPEADLYVPYYVYIPTPAGTASLTSSGFKVETSGRSRGAQLQ